MPTKDTKVGRMFISKRNLNPAYFALAERLGAHIVVLDTSNRADDGAGLPRDVINIFEPPDCSRAEVHGRTCECFPCQQANYRMDRDDPSAGGDEG